MRFTWSLRAVLLRISSGRLASGFAVSRRKILPRGPSWAPIVFRATKVVHAGNKIAVTARVQSDDVAHALETAAPNDFGAGEEHRFTMGRALSPCSSGERREHHDDRAFQVDGAAIGDHRWAPRQHA